MHFFLVFFFLVCVENILQSCKSIGTHTRTWCHTHTLDRSCALSACEQHQKKTDTLYDLYRYSDLSVQLKRQHELETQLYAHNYMQLFVLLTILSFVDKGLSASDTAVC